VSRRGLAGLRRLAAAVQVVFLVGAVTAAGAGAAEAFRNVRVGDVLDNPTLQALEGPAAPLVDPAQRVSVFVFVRPDQDHSREALEQLAACQQELGSRPVRWAAVVSDRHEAARVHELVDGSGFRGPVLFDPGDAVYGSLGVSLHPSAGVAGGDLRLAAYQPFEKLRFAPLVCARVRHALGEIDDDELARIVHPVLAEEDDATAGARRKIAYARVLLEKGKADRAVEQARAAVEQAPELADAHAVLGDALAASGDCPAARSAYDRALELDPAHEAARTGRQRCAG